MIKEGPLGSVHLLQLLGEIFVERFTGAMRLESESKVRIIYFKDGDIVSCGTNVNAEKIDEVLLSLGRITRDHIREVLEMSASSSEIGKRMLSLGFLSAAELEDALRHQTLLIVRNLLPDTAGTFSLVEHYTPTRTDVFHYPTHHFLSDFLRATDDRELVFSILPPPSTRVRTRPGAAALVDTLPWGAEEKAVVANLNGRVSLAELTGLSRLREMDIYKLVATLACLGAVEVADDAAASSPAAEPPVPEPEPSFLPPSPSNAAPAPLAGELFPPTRPASKPEIGIPRTHRHNARSRRLFVVYPLALIGVVVVGMGGVLAWQKLKPEPSQPAPPPATQPKPAKPAPIVLPEPKPGPSSSGEEAMVLAPPAAATPAPGPAAASQPVPSPTPPVGTPAKPEPTPPASAKPTPPSPSPARPEPKPPTSEAPPAPVAAPAPTGRYAEQARAHLDRAQGLPSTHLTIQLMIACQDDSIAKALAADSKGELWFIPFAFKGRACYKVYWGEYSSAASAQGALQSLPEAFQAGKPQVVSLGAALKNASP
jgi:septal ring-binding cell division protein DamX